MKSKKCLFIWHCTIIIAYLVYSNVAHAQPSAPCPNETGQFNCSLQATPAYTPANNYTIYDDAPNVNFEASGFSNGNISACAPWNCGSTFLLTGYTSTNIPLSIGYSSTYAASSTIFSHNIIVTNVGDYPLRACIQYYLKIKNTYRCYI